jgi:hypothetical protein
VQLIARRKEKKRKEKKKTERKKREKISEKTRLKTANQIMATRLFLRWPSFAVVVMM